MLLVFCVLFSLSSSFAEEIPIVKSDVVLLSKDSFDTLTSQGFWLVRFFAEWCVHCNRMKPAWEELASVAKEFGYLIGDVNAPQEKELSKKFGVRGYPSIFFIHGQPENRLIRDYDGDHTVDEFLSFLHKMSKPPVRLVETIPPLNEEPIVVLFGEDLNGLFSRVATTFQPKRTWFFQILDPSDDLLQKLGIGRFPAVATLSTDSKSFYDGPWNQDALSRWTSEHRHPVLGTLTRSAFQELRTMNKLLVFAVVNMVQENVTNRYLDFFREIALSSTDPKLLFLKVDAARFTSFVRHYGIKNPTTVPRILLLDAATQESWVDEGIDLWDEKAVRGFVDSVLRGRVPPGLQPLPQKLGGWLRKVGTHWKLWMPIGGCFFVAAILACCWRPRKVGVEHGAKSE